MGARLAALWDRFLFTGSTPERLGYTRIVLGIGLIPFHLAQFNSLLKVDWRSLRPVYFLDPIWYFQPLGIEAHIPVFSVAVLVLLVCASLGFALGWRTRASLVIVLLCVFYLKGVRDSIAGDLHHRYLIPTNILLLFLMSRCGDVASWDARRAAAKGARLRPLETWQASWPIMSAQLYCCSFYLWSGIAKARISGAEWGEGLAGLLVRRATRYAYDGTTGGEALALEVARADWLGPTLGVATYVFELGFPLILFVTATGPRLIFFLGVAFFHLANFVLISVKFLLLPLIFVIFFDLDALWRRLSGHARAPASAAP